MLGERLYALVNWFIPEKLKADADVVQGVRMFLISHFFGPFLGHTISLYILYIQGKPDWRLGGLLRCDHAVLAVLLRAAATPAGTFRWPSSRSRTCSSASSGAVYHYGGVSSPILPWLDHRSSPGLLLSADAPRRGSWSRC